MEGYNLEEEMISEGLAIQIGKEVYNNHKGKHTSQEEYWITISKNWDLNIWTDDETDEFKGAIYPVDSGGDIVVSKEIMVSE